MNNLYGWEMSQKLPVNNFERIEDTSQFNEDFIKNYNRKCDEWYFLEVDVQYLENYMNFIMIYYFSQKELKLKREKLVASLHDKTEYLLCT